MTCFKEHKQTPCAKPSEPPRELDSLKEPTSEYDYPTEDTVPLDKLKLLGNIYMQIHFGTLAPMDSLMYNVVV